MDQNAEHIWTLMARKLSGEATIPELEELEGLLIENPREHYSLEVMQDIWDNKGTPDPQYSENKYKELVIRMQRLGIDNETSPGEKDHSIINKVGFTEQQQGLKPYLLGSLAIIAILFAGLVYYYQYTDENKVKEIQANNEISTRYGSKSNMVLPDGTKVYLNSGSKLTYDKNYGTDIREVNLTGEGYFDVIKNPKKPFIIHTSNINIRVLGTAFNVRCYPDEKNTETSLVRGSLEVTVKNGQQKIILKPNEKLIVSNPNNDTKKENAAGNNKGTLGENNIIELSHVSLLDIDSSIIETSWVNNRLVFRSETFEQIATKMERWFGVNIQFANDKLKGLKFTGVFEKETVDQALKALQLTTFFSYKINKDSIVIFK